MQDDPRYDDVVSDVKAFLEERLAFAVADGIAEERIQLDPGIGFGKTVDHNLELLRRLDEFVSLGRPVVVGTSRKSFLGRITGRDGSTSACPGPSPRTSSPGARAPPCSASTTSPRARRARGGGCYGPRRDGRRRRRPDDPTRTTTSSSDDDERAEPLVTSRSPGSRSTPTTASATPSARSASAWSSTCASTSATCDATVTDRVEDTVDYGEVCQAVALVAQQRSYRTLERLCAAIADRLLDALRAPSACRCKAAKPEPPIPLPVEEVSVELCARMRRRSAERHLTRRLPRARAPTSATGARMLEAAVAALPRHGVRVLALPRSTRPSRSGEVARPARLPQRLRRDRDRSSSPRRCSTRARRSSASSAATPGGARHGPRPIDVDVLLLGDVVLRVRAPAPPAPRGHHRRFVLVPAARARPGPDDPGRPAARRRAGRARAGPGGPSSGPPLAATASTVGG